MLYVSFTKGGRRALLGVSIAEMVSSVGSQQGDRLEHTLNEIVLVLLEATLIVAYKLANGETVF